MRSIALLTMMCLVALPVAAQTEVERRCALAADAAVDIRNVAGTVKVKVWEKAEAHVHARLGKDVIRMDFTCSDRRLLLDVVVPKRVTGRMDIKAHLVVHIPDRASLDVHVVSASAEIEGVGGRIDVNAVSGDTVIRANPPELSAKAVSGEIEIAGNTEDLRVQTVSGEILIEGNAPMAKVGTVSGDIRLHGGLASLRVESVSGDILANGALGVVEAESVSGEIRLATVAENAELSTVSGDMRIETGAVSDVSLGTTSGDIDFAGDLAPNGRMRLGSTSGDIEIALPRQVNTLVEVRTDSGDIGGDLDGQVRRRRPGEWLDAKLGDGAGRIQVNTASGDVDIRLR